MSCAGRVGTKCRIETKHVRLKQPGLDTPLRGYSTDGPRRVSVPVLLLCTLVSAGDATFRVAVVPRSAERAVLPDGVGVTVLPAEGLAEEGLRSLFDLVMSARPGFTESQIKGIEGFVRGGGHLVLVGRAGRFIDGNGNGTFEKETDRYDRGGTLAEVTGAEVSLVSFQAARARVYQESPVTRRVHVGRWIPYPRTGSPSLVRLRANHARCLAGVDLDTRAPRGGPARARRQDISALYVGEAPLLTVHEYGAGLAVRCAADLLLARPGGRLLEVLMENLLRPQTWARLRANYHSYARPVPSYGQGELLENGGIERSYRILSQPTRKDNHIAALPYHMPGGWRYNSYGGQYFGCSTTDAAHKGKFALKLKHVGRDAEVSTGGANFQKWLDMTRLKNGGSYLLSFWVKAQGATRASASLWCMQENGEYLRKSFHVPAGTFPWRRVERQFTLEPFPRAGEKLVAGTVILFCLGGTGEILFDDVSLSRLP